MKTGKTRQGIRWHSSNDTRQVRAIAEKKAYAAIGKTNIEWVEAVPTARTGGNRMDTKNL
jgi:hypothetical protein